MPETNKASNPETPSLPASYGKTSIFLMAVDPYSAHIIWEVDADDMSRLSQKGCRPVIELHEITENLSHAPKARTPVEVKININDKKNYIALPKAGRTYSAELGFKNAAGHFFPLAQSNYAEAPRDTPVTELSPNNAPETTAPARQIPVGHIAAAGGKAEKFSQTRRPLENRVLFDTEAVSKYIKAIEIINNPPPGISFLPHTDIKPSFTSFDYSRLHENLPGELSQHGPDFDLTAFNERRFIAGISSR